LVENTPVQGTRRKGLNPMLVGINYPWIDYGWDLLYVVRPGDRSSHEMDR
jgi:hypothetical protein